MPNTFTNPTWVVNETAYRWMNSVKGVPAFNRTYSDEYRQAGAKVGDTVFGRKPQRYVVRNGQAWAPQALNDQTFPVTLKYQRGVDFDYSSASATTEVDRVRERYVNPAADRLANDTDAQGMTDVYTAVYHAVGTPGTPVTSNQTYLNAGVLLDDMATNPSGRLAILDQQAQASIVGANLTLFNPQDKIGKMHTTGEFGNGNLGFDTWYKDQNMPTHTTGSFTACSPTVNGASQTGSSLITQAWASGASTLNKGDVFTIAGVDSVNPANDQDTSRPQQFVVTATISDTTGAMTISISPSIITSGALQTVSASPANGAAISVWGVAAGSALTATRSKQSLIFQTDAFAFVMADLVEPIGGADSSFVRSKDWNLSIRFVRQYLLAGDQNGSRLDILWGTDVIEPGFACRVAG